jgi:predicted Zn-dependent peptidase
MNDGVLILVGDYDELTMKKALSQYIGGFQTDKVVTYRAKIEYDPVKIKTIRYRDGNFPSVDIALRAEMNFTAEGFMASYIAGAVVTQELRRTAAKMGWTCLAESHLVMFPAEEFNVKVYMNPAAREGLPASMVMSLHSEELVTRIRFALEDLSARGVSEAELSAYKGILGSYYESVTADPQQIINMLLLRYSYGKDMVANNSSKLKAVTKESVDAVITALCKGGIAESVVRAKENVTVHSDNPEILNYPEVPPVTFTAAADTTGISQMGLDIANEINVNK